jgi:site-specific DNA-cytosine methylase
MHFVLSLTFHSTGHGELKPALTLGVVIGDRKIFPPFDPEERANADNTVNTEWEDRFEARWTKNDARCNGGVLNHRSFVLNEDDSARVRLVPEGGNWEDIQRLVSAGAEPPQLPSGKPLVSKYMSNNKKGNADLPFKRLKFSEGMRTVICRIVPHTQQSIHPTDNRVMSVREMMSVQGFPTWYVVRGSLEKQYKQAGNAVPPPLAKAIGVALRRAAANQTIAPMQELDHAWAVMQPQ